MAKKPKKRVAGYIRVSSDVQVKGHSLKYQKEVIEKYCAKNKYQLVGVYSDPGKSGADIEGRCGLKRLLHDAASGKFEIVAVTRHDRLSRDLYYALWLEKELRRTDVELVCIEQDIEGPPEMVKLFRQITGAFSEYEKNLSVKKMRFGKQRKFEDGSGPVCGNISYGYRTEGPRGNRRIVEVPEEQEVIKFMKKLRRDGISYARIAQVLNGERPVPMTGETIIKPARPWNGQPGKWHSQKIKNALTSNHVQGKVSYGGKVKKIKK